MTHASVFSGIGGPEVAATMLGWENLFHCEINPFGRTVLDYWYPHSKSYDDITQTDFREWRGKVDVLTGGFPCQPFSYAGKRGGAQDDRYLWPHMHRCINEVRPRWVVAENVAGILTMVEQGEVTDMASQATLFGEADRLRRYQLRETFTLQRICDDLESNGYTVQPVLIPACAVGAPHRRDRVFIVGCRNDAFSEDSLYGGLLYGQHEKQRSERDKRHAGTGNSERLCGETSGTAFADTSEQCGSQIEFRQSQTCRKTQGKSGGGSGEDGSGRIAADTGNEEADTRDGYDFDSSWHRLGRLLQREEHGDAQGQRQIAQDITDHIRSVSPDNGRWETFPSVSPVHRGDDGLPFPVDDLTIPFSKWRTESLKAYGNAIVPQVMYEIFRAIEQTEREMQK